MEVVGQGGQAEADDAISVEASAVAEVAEAVEAVEAAEAVEAVVSLEVIETPAFEFEIDADSIEVYPADDVGDDGHGPAGRPMRDPGRPDGPGGGLGMGSGEDDVPGF